MGPNEVAAAAVVALCLPIVIVGTVKVLHRWAARTLEELRPDLDPQEAAELDQRRRRNERRIDDPD